MEGSSLNIYDFDKTIYHGDSSFDFFKFSLMKHKKNFLKLPRILWRGLKFKLHILPKKEFKSTVFSIVQNTSSLQNDVEEFWNRNEHKIKKFYLANKKEDDLIISASPEFLLKPICERLQVSLIATNVDTKTGELIGENCHGAEKVKRLDSKYHVSSCDEFYSDSLCDDPLAQIAQKAFLVKGEKLFDWPKK